MSQGPVVVVMLTHRDPALVQRLVDRVLQGRDVAVVVHHDPRSPELGLRPSSQVTTVPDPVRASWGRIGLARAVLLGLDTAARVVPDLSWALVVSGQDYPCRPMSSIEDELHAGGHDAYLRWFPVGDPADDVVPWQALTRERYLHRMRLPGTHRHVPFARRPPFRDGLGLFIGDMWPNLSAAAMDHVRSQRERYPVVERYLARCQAPDEALLPTLLLNDAEHLDVVNDRKRFIRWTPGSPHPKVLTTADLDDVLASGDFFARKVDGERGAELLDQLDAAARG
jgi:hypothetical protein